MENQNHKLYLRNNYKFPYAIIWTNICVLIPGIFLLFVYAKKYSNTKHVIFNNLVLLLGVLIIISSIVSAIHHTSHNSFLCCTAHNRPLFSSDVIFCNMVLILMLIMVFYYTFFISEKSIRVYLLSLLFLFLIAISFIFYLLANHYSRLCKEVGPDIKLTKKYVDIEIPSNLSREEKINFIRNEITKIKRMVKFRKKYEFYHSIWHMMGSLTGLFGILIFINY